MMHPRSKSLLSSSCLAWILLAPCGCDDDGVGVHELVLRTEGEAAAELVVAGCFWVGHDGEVGGGGGGNDEFATETLSSDGHIRYRYFIAPEDATSLDAVTPDNGELAAEIDADTEFFDSGETKHVVFETYGGVRYDAYLWGEADCEGDLPSEPPEDAP